MPAGRTGVGGPYRVEALGARVEVDSPLTGATSSATWRWPLPRRWSWQSAHGFPITPAAIAEGDSADALAGAAGTHRAAASTAWSGFWTWRTIRPAPGRLRAGLGDAGRGAPRTLIFSCLRDKPVAEMAQILVSAL
jgi:dihydrofolate synthase/folylpolyglutamate synthase